MLWTLLIRYILVTGIPTHVLVNATNLDPPARLTNLELVDLKGDPIAKFPLTQDPELPALYNVTSFIPPDQFFYLKVFTACWQADFVFLLPVGKHI